MESLAAGFFTVFYSYHQVFISGKKTGYQAMPAFIFWVFPNFSHLLMSQALSCSAGYSATCTFSF